MKSSTFLCGAAASLLLVISGTAAAEEAYELDIADQELSSALKSFAEQSGLQVVYFADVADGKHTDGLAGTYKAEAALSLLLADTGLTLTQVDQQTWSIAPPAVPAEAEDPGNFQPAPSHLMAWTSAAGNTRQTGSQSTELRQDTAASSREREDLEEVVVTGTRIRSADVAAPTIGFSRDEIDQAGFATLEDLFESLPQNLGEISPGAVGAAGASRIASGNTQRASGISLRGLGPESTLVLLNGERRPGNIAGRVVDISAIPLSVIERVEIVTGGRSAIYGADAVAGVVNLITRRSFDGAETQVYFGAAGEGGERFQASQTIGVEGAKGGFVAAYDYLRDWGLDLVKDTDVARSPSPFGITLSPDGFSVIPERERHSLFFSGSYELRDGIETYSDFLYSANENKANLRYTAPFAPGGSFQNTDTESDQYSGVLGARIDLGSSWGLDVSGLHGAVDNHELFSQVTGPGGVDTKSDLSSLSAVADGNVFSLGGTPVKAAIGMEFRQESYEAVDVISGELEENRDRTVKSIFAELLIPLVDDDASPGLRELELSLAARYDHYDDFGGTFNPQVGMTWRPVESLSIRGAYSTAFRAPALFTLAFAETGSQAFLQPSPDPFVPEGVSPTLFLFGSNPELQPEEATTWSLGFDYAPEFAEGTRLSASYFEIDYDGRIGPPIVLDRLDALVYPELYGAFTDRDPSAAEVERIVTEFAFDNFSGIPFDPNTQDLLDVVPNLVVFDNRRTNIAEDTVKGLDLELASEFDTGFGQLSFGLNGTYYLELDQKTSSAAQAIDQLNQPGNPVEFRFRARAGWARSAYSAHVFLDYVDDYRDTIASPSLPVDSWTTVDLSLRLDTSGLVDGGLTDDVVVAFHVDNALDEAPPEFLSNPFGVGYDGANSSPLGRFMSLQLTKSW